MNWEEVGLNAEEARLVFFQQSAVWESSAQMVRARDALTPDDRKGLDSSVRRNYADSPVGRLFYDWVSTGVANPDAVRYVDDLLARSK
jgi:hypothetical protein